MPLRILRSAERRYKHSVCVLVNLTGRDDLGVELPMLKHQDGLIEKIFKKAQIIILFSVYSKKCSIIHLLTPE